jgi:hypothetical protein
LHTLDEHSGLRFDGLSDELGLDLGPGPMALVFTLLELAEAGLVAIDGMSSRKTYAAVRQSMTKFMFGAEDVVWRTTSAG